MDIYYIDDKVRIRKFNIVEIDGESTYVETKEWKDYKLKKRVESLVIQAGLPLHVKTLTLDDYIGSDREKIDKLKLYLEKFEEKFKNIHLYFWSKENGTQKTTTASIVGKMLLEKGYSAQFVLMSTLLKMLSEEKFEEGHVSTLNSYRSCDFLIIDDSFDKKKATIYRSGFQIPFLDEFLRKRLEVDRKATCFSSNFSIDEIDEETFGKSLKNLVKRSISEPFLFKSSIELRNDFDPSDLWS